MLIRSLQNIRFISKGATFCTIPNTLKSTCQVKPVEIVLKRNASIHTRNIFIQKLRLEHINSFGVLLMLFPVTTLGLGVWQIKRKIWKEQLIADLKRQMSKEPVDIPDNLVELNDMEYQTVRARGRFLHDKEMYLGPRSLIEPADKKKGVLALAPKSGYLVITPFQLEGREEIILVNRGWVPKTQKSPSQRQRGQVEGVVEISGVVRKHENRPQFMPKMHDNKLFLYRDVHRMSSISGTEPYLLDATLDSNVLDGPIGGQTTINIRNEHLSYVVTWFGLSGLSAYFWYKLVYLAPK